MHDLATIKRNNALAALRECNSRGIPCIVRWDKGDEVCLSYVGELPRVRVQEVSARKYPLRWIHVVMRDDCDMDKLFKYDRAYAIVQDGEHGWLVGEFEVTND